MFTHILQRIGSYAKLKFQPFTQNPNSPPRTVQSLHSVQQYLGQKSCVTSTDIQLQDSETRNVMWHALRSALRGDKNAQYQMGIFYLHGQLGLDRNYSHAEKWLDQAAHQGHSAAKHELEDAYAQLAFS